MTKLLVAGGKEYDNKEVVYEILDWFMHNYNITEICYGDVAPCTKAATTWAKTRGIVAKAYKPNYKQNGYGGKHVRNQQMVDDFQPQIAVFFPCDRHVWEVQPTGKTRKRRGTDDIRKRCKLNGVTMLEVVVVNGEEELRTVA